MAITVVIVISFAFLYSDYDFVAGAMGQRNCAVRVYNRCYRQKEAQKIAANFDVAYQMGMYDFAMVLYGENRMDRDPTEFIINLIILRQEAEKLGIEPSVDEIKAAIPQLPIFQQPWVNAQFIDNNILGPNGFTQPDLAQLVKDYLSYQKIRDLIGAGIEGLPSEAKMRYIQQNQRYTTSVIRFDRSGFTKDIKITDEDVKKYYEDNKDNLKSSPKREFEFVKFTAKPIAEGATNEEKAKTNLKFANATNRAYADLAEEGADFMGIAKKIGAQEAFSIETGKLAPFSRDEAPEILKGRDEALTALFSGAMLVGGVSVPVEVGEGIYYVFHCANIIEPMPLTLEEATPAIREVLLSTRSNRAVNDATSAALAKLNDAVKGGKSFADAAKEQGLKVDILSGFSLTEPPAGIDDAAVIVRAASELREKETSGVMERPGGEGYFLLHVDKIEIYKDDQAETKQKAIVASIKVQTDRMLFRAWFNQRRIDSGGMRSAHSTDPMDIDVDSDAL